MLDEIAERIKNTIKENTFEGKSLTHLATVYAVMSIGYYVFNRSHGSDGYYDRLCKHLHDNYDKAIEAGVWKCLIDKDMLEAGTGMQFTNLNNLSPAAMSIFDIERHMKNN